jgi:hypothetical protein
MRWPTRPSCFQGPNPFRFVHVLHSRPKKGIRALPWRARRVDFFDALRHQIS